MKNWVQTYTGRAFDLDNPTPAMVDIADIAHALSNQCRFGGHTSEFYSVAQHSVWCSYLAPRHLRLAALLHDASEAYVMDLPRPVKRMLPGYAEIEARVQQVIGAAFHIDHRLFHCLTVKDIDNRMLMTEARDLMQVPPVAWPETHEPYGNVWARPTSPAQAKAQFLTAFRKANAYTARTVAQDAEAEQAELLASEGLPA